MTPAHYIALAGALGAAFCAGWAWGIWWREREERRERAWTERLLQDIDREYREEDSENL